MISKRSKSVDSSGIRKVFDLAAKIENPINLSIGQPDFPASESIKAAAIHAIENNHSGYTPTQGLQNFRELLAEARGVPEGHEVFLTSGVSAGLLLSYMVLLDPGDEILIPDPFFCMYRDLSYMLGAVPTYYDTYPNFQLKLEAIERAMTPKTKAIVLNSPSNPTGYAYSSGELEPIIELARSKKVPIIYDEIYSNFCYDAPHVDLVGRYELGIVLNGFSKSVGIPGWRAGYVIAPQVLAQEMLKLQQYTFVCMNSIAQHCVPSILEEDFEPLLQSYRKKRDLVVEGIKGKFEFVEPGGAFYLFPKAPGGSGIAFVEKCLERKLLLVPGSVFSRVDSHFRISFSASLENLEKGVEILRSLA